MSSDLPRGFEPEDTDVAGLAPALEAWIAQPLPAGFPYDETLETYLALGKHFVPAAVTQRLSQARDCIADTPRANGHRASTDVPRQRAGQA